VNVHAVFDLADPVLWLVTAHAPPRRGGLIATFVCSGSLVPTAPRVVLGLARHHHTWALIEASHAFALHLVDERHIDWVWRFGLSSGRDGEDKLDGLPLRSGPGELPVLAELPGWMTARVEDRWDTGDRTVYLGAVTAGERTGNGPVLTLSRMLALASPSQRQQLKALRDRDAAVDAAGIERWRTARASPSA
jgi:flavin reductase (DIM6/NTAB) family NADH-FMN oxidoreductase RutF